MEGGVARLQIGTFNMGVNWKVVWPDSRWGQW